MMHFIKAGTVVGGLVGTLVLALASQDPSEVTQAEANLAVAQTLLRSDHATTQAQQFDEDRRRASYLAKKAKEKAKQDVIQQLTSNAELRQGSIKQICQVATHNLSDYKVRQYEGDNNGLAQWSHKQSTVKAKLRLNCQLANDPMVASCFADTLEHAPTSYGDIAHDLLRSCIDVHNPKVMDRIWR